MAKELNDTQRLILSAAAARDDLRALPLPETLRARVAGGSFEVSVLAPDRPGSAVSPDHPATDNSTAAANTATATDNSTAAAGTQTPRRRRAR